jgi:hypothetical protein
MKKTSITFLQVIVVLIGIIVLAFMLIEPHFEGRNVNATFFEVYFKDPFLAYAYSASIAFFLTLYQTFKLLKYMGRNEVLSERSMKALRTIRYSALALVGFVILPLAYLFIARPEDDIAGGVAIGLFILTFSAISAALAGVFEKSLRSAVEIKSQNNLTV